MNNHEDIYTDIQTLYNKVHELERELDQTKDDLRRAQWEIDDLKRTTDRLENQISNLERYR